MKGFISDFQRSREEVGKIVEEILWRYANEIVQYSYSKGFRGITDNNRSIITEVACEAFITLACLFAEQYRETGKLDLACGPVDTQSLVPRTKELHRKASRAMREAFDVLLESLGFDRDDELSELDWVLAVLKNISPSYASSSTAMEELKKNVQEIADMSGKRPAAEIERMQEAVDGIVTVIGQVAVADLEEDSASAGKALIKKANETKLVKALEEGIKSFFLQSVTEMEMMMTAEDMMPEDPRVDTDLLESLLSDVDLGESPMETRYRDVRDAITVACWMSICKAYGISNDMRGIRKFPGGPKEYKEMVQDYVALFGQLARACGLEWGEPVPIAQAVIRLRTASKIGRHKSAPNGADLHAVAQCILDMDECIQKRLKSSQ